MATTRKKVISTRKPVARKPARSSKITKVAGTRGLTRKRDIFAQQGSTSGVRQSGRRATSAIP